MNIYLNVFALVIMILILIFFFFNRKLIVKFNKIYLSLIFVIILSIMLDFLLLLFSTIDVNQTFSKFIQRLYLILLTTDAFIAYIYSINLLIDNDFKIRKRKLIIGSIIFAISFILISTLRLESAVDASGQKYLIGPALCISYTASFIFMLLSLVVVIQKRNTINKRKILAIVIYISLWAFSTGLQIILNFIKPTETVTYFGRLSSAIGALSIFALVENPENDTESEFGILNDTAFVKYIKNNYKDDFTILTVDKNHFKGHEDVLDLLKSLLHTQSKNKVFKYEPYTYIFVSDNQNYQNISKILETKIENYLKENKYIHYHIYCINKSLNIDSANHLINYIDKIIIDTIYDNKTSTITNEQLTQIKEHIRISKLVNHCLNNDEIEVYYQPIIDTKTEKVVSAEALVRLKDKTGSIVSPQLFIPIVEFDGRIKELSDKIFEHVCKFISTHDLETLGLKYIEFNLSPKQFDDYNFIYKYLSIMKKYNINAKYINFEITETSNSNLKKAVQIMNFFLDYGFTFSLDDFGTGNSNLNYIIDMPVEIVKFDKSMIDSYFSSNQEAKIVIDESINIIKKLNKKIVFEGIETKEQVDSVKKLDVDFIQGYYYSKPLNEDDFIEFLKK